MARFEVCHPEEPNSALRPWRTGRDVSKGTSSAKSMIGLAFSASAAMQATSDLVANSP